MNAQEDGPAVRALAQMEMDLFSSFSSDIECLQVNSIRIYTLTDLSFNLERK